MNIGANDEALGEVKVLVIARELVEAMGGTIELGESTLGGLKIRFVWGAK